MTTCLCRSTHPTWPRRWLALCVVVASAGAAAQTKEESEYYVVKSGDTCQSVSRKVWPDDRNALDRLHQLNPWLGPREPHYLRTGMRLSISATAPDARITSLRPRVNAKKSGRRAWEEAARGRALYRLDQVNTLNDANAMVTFRDGSALYLDQQALVVIYGVYVGKKQRQKTGSVELVQGDMRLKLQELRGEAARVDTPAASVVPEAKEMAVGVDKKKTARVSVFDGKATVAGKGKSVLVDKGYGTLIEQGKPPEPPQPLPPPPAWEGTGTRDVWLVGSDATASPSVAWKGVAGAEQYKLELARDENFGDRLVVTVRPAASPPGETFSKLAPGRYYARASSLNAAGLIGVASPSRVIDVIRVKAENGDGCTGVGEVRLALEGPAEVDFSVDGKPAAAPVTVRGVGGHEVKLAPKGGGRGVAVTCQVLRPRANIELRGESAVIALLDDAGKPVTVQDAPELAVEGKDGTAAMPLRRDGETWSTQVTPFAKRTERGVKLVALWGGAPIGEVVQVERIATPAPPPPPRQVSLAYPVGQPSTTIELAPPPAIAPPRPYAVGLRVEPAIATVVGASDGVRFAIDGELGFGRLGIYASGTIDRGAELNGVEQSPRSFTAGARYRFLTGVDVFADATVPLDPTYVSGRLGLQGSVPAGRFTLSTAQAGMLSRGGGVEETAWVSSYLAGWHMTEMAAVVLGGEAVIGSIDAGDVRAFAGAAGLRARLGLFEAGFSARVGLGDDGKQIFGVMALLFSLEARP